MGNASCIFYNCGWALITYIVNFKKNQKGSGQVENVMNSIFANSANVIFHGHRTSHDKIDGRSRCEGSFRKNPL